MKKLFTKEFRIILLLALVFVITACGKEITLADWCNNSEDFQTMVQTAKNSVGNEAQVDVSVVENTIYFTYKYNEVIDLSDSRVKSLLNTYFNRYMEEDADQVVASLKEIEEKTKLDGVSVQYDFYNGDGSLLYSKLFTSN